MKPSRACADILATLTLAAFMQGAAKADVADMNVTIHRAIDNPARTCARVGLLTMVGAQVADYLTSVRNFNRGAIENDFSARPFIAVTHSKPIGLALGMAAWDLGGLYLTRRSDVLRCAFEVRQTTLSVGNVGHNNAVRQELPR